MKLQDIFTIHPDTACHTHDLLECPCDNSEEMRAIKDFDADDEPAEDSDEENERGFMHASQVKAEHIEKQDKEVSHLREISQTEIYWV